MVRELNVATYPAKDTAPNNHACKPAVVPTGVEADPPGDATLRGGMPGPDASRPGVSRPPAHDLAGGGWPDTPGSDGLRQPVSLSTGGRCPQGSSSRRCWRGLQVAEVFVVRRHHEPG